MKRTLSILLGIWIPVIGFAEGRVGLSVDYNPALKELSHSAYASITFLPDLALAGEGTLQNPIGTPWSYTVAAGLDMSVTEALQLKARLTQVGSRGTIPQIGVTGALDWTINGWWGGRKRTALQLGAGKSQGVAWVRPGLRDSDQRIYQYTFNAGVSQQLSRVFEVSGSYAYYGDSTDGAEHLSVSGAVAAQVAEWLGTQFFFAAASRTDSPGWTETLGMSLTLFGARQAWYLGGHASLSTGVVSGGLDLGLNW